MVVSVASRENVLRKELQAWRPCALEIHLMGGPARAIRSCQPRRMPWDLAVPALRLSVRAQRTVSVPRYLETLRVRSIHYHFPLSGLTFS